MNRRQFIRTGIGLSALTGTMHAWQGAGRSSRAVRPSPGTPLFDLVAVKGGQPDVMFTKGIEALGGMATFVNKGQKVVVKPNIGWDVPPERAGNTNPRLIEEIVKQCYQAGASEVYVFDNTCDNWERTYKNSGISAAVKNANGKIAPANVEGYYQRVKIPGGVVLKDAKVHELLLDADVVINVPILKNHGSTQITMAMKNLMGVVWDRQYWHRNDLHQCIADFATYHKPTLNVLDAYYVLKQNGPRGVSVDDVVEMRSMLLSTDMVAIDAAGAKLFGRDPEEIRYIRLAQQQRAGRGDLDALRIKRITLS